MEASRRESRDEDEEAGKGRPTQNITRETALLGEEWARQTHTPVLNRLLELLTRMTWKSREWQEPGQEAVAGTRRPKALATKTDTGSRQAVVLSTSHRPRFLSDSVLYCHLVLVLPEEALFIPSGKASCSKWSCPSLLGMSTGLLKSFARCARHQLLPPAKQKYVFKLPPTRTTLPCWQLSPEGLKRMGGFFYM